MDLLTAAIATYGGVLLSKAEEDKFRDALVSMSASVTATAPATVVRMVDAVDVGFTELRLVDDGLFEDGLVIGGTNRIKVKLRRQPEIMVARDGTYKVPSWNVSCPFPDTSRRHLLASEMCRKIVSLHKAAVERRLSATDMKVWLNILNDIDYADYCEQIKPPVPTTGRLVRREQDGVVVEFFGCSEEKLVGEPADALDIIREGERFSVLFKRMYGKITIFSNVAPEPDVSEGELKDYLSRAKRTLA